MNDHVSKPIDPDALFATLARWAKPRQTHAPEIAVKQVSAADEIIIPEIAGVNSADGLKRVAGNRRLYRELLSQFTEKQGDASVQISEALKSGGGKLAERIAHTVKGVAGNIGIAGIQSAAARLEKAVREGDPAVSALLEGFAALMGSQVRSIQQALSDTTPARGEHVQDSVFSTELASAAVARLKSLLEASDADASEAFTDLRNMIAGQGDQTLLNALGAAISDFDFDGAKKKLEEIARKHGLNGDRHQ
jgi:HPt (histidine-containing phosphotransfer) domain-containing protein